jgi:hypothetical protein
MEDWLGKPNPENKICMCDCHVKGQQILHFMSCCKYCGESYINTDGSLDMDAYRLVEEKYRSKSTSKNGR